MTGRNGRRAWHAVGRTEALAATLAALLIAVVDQLGAAVRIDAPEGSLAGLILRTRHLDEIPASGQRSQCMRCVWSLKCRSLVNTPIQTEIMTYGILPALSGLLAVVRIMLDNERINARECQLLVWRGGYGLNNQLGVAIRRLLIVIIAGCRRCLE